MVLLVFQSWISLYSIKLDFSIKTTTWCYHIYYRRLERKTSWKNNVTIVVTTFINAIFWALYTVMAKQNISRIRLKRSIIYHKIMTHKYIITNLHSNVRNRIFLKVLIIVDQSFDSHLLNHPLKPFSISGIT